MMRACGVLRGSIAIVMMLVFLTSCAGSGMSSMQGSRPPQPTGSVIGSQTVTLFADKSFQSQPVGTLHPGDSVAIEQESGDWRQVRIDNGNGQPVTGWVPANFIQENTVQKTGGKDLTGMKARTTVEGGLTGAAVGAAAGALVAALIGVNPAKGAAWGAALGAPMGLAAGVYVANQKQKYANEEEYLDACIKQARQYNEEARKDVAYMKSYIAREQIRVATLKKEIAMNESKKGLALAELKAMTAKKQDMDKAIGSLEGEVNAQQTALAGATTDPQQIETLKSEVAATRESIQSFKKERDQLISVMMKTKNLTL
ncbi:MAG: hypothetical protein M0Z81_03070 [Deltaproteobacteria bacterium]|nr:hypothetical protein [Deltaproteobacteria bacterium]